ncbi:uncharacterized protein LOC111945006, partial [Cyanistes caeruleus]|uniref:uncharacterized protein LOC111945006 n=1 Tax=Cyanistes caeruleus TaxID=156563 RepID=UPI000CDB5307
MAKGKVARNSTLSAGDDVSIRCRLSTRSHTEPVHSQVAGSRGQVISCETRNQDCWLNLTAVQLSSKVVCGKNNTKYWGELNVQVVLPTTQPPIRLTPKISEIGPYVIRKTGQQQMLFNPAWSIKQVKLLMQNNVSEIQPACSPFLQTSFEGWTTWLRKRNSFHKRMTRDITGVVGSGLGILNSIDSEVLMNKLAVATKDLTKIQQPLRSSLTALGTQQWLLSNILPNWERVNVDDHKLIIDALSATQNNVSLALSCIQAQLW